MATGDAGQTETARATRDIPAATARTSVQIFAPEWAR